MAKIFSVTSVSIAILKSSPVQLLVTATGMASTSGWKISTWYRLPDPMGTAS
jgi:hypothetical protein